MDPLLKMAVDIAGSEKVKALTLYLDQQAQSVRTLNAQLANGTVNQTQYNSAVAHLGGGIQQASQKLQQLQGAALGGGRALGQLAYAIDDVQYGFNAIVNNIPQIALGLGLGAGVAGAAGIAAVAVNQLMKHWGELTDVFKSAFSDVPIAALEKIRERAEEAAGAFERLSKAQTKGGSAEQKGIEDILVEGPLDNIIEDLAGKIANDQLLGARRKTAIGRQPRTQSDLPEIGGGGPNSSQAELDAEKVDADRKTAERLAGQAASKDPVARAAAISEIGRLNPELGKQLEAQSPEAQTKRKQAKEDAAEEKQWKDEVRKIDEDRRKLDQAEEKQWRHEVWQIQREQEQKFRTNRIQTLEDQREAVMKDVKQLNADKGHPGQILGGAKEAIDMYQKAAGVNAEKLALLKAADKKLEVIADAMKRERRLVLAK